MQEHSQLSKLIDAAFLDVDVFVNSASGIKLRKYQRGVAQAIAQSIATGAGLSFVVMFPRQSGKNELQAQLETYLLTIFHSNPCDIVKVSPTWKPQTLNAMRRLERVLGTNVLSKGL